MPNTSMHRPGNAKPNTNRQSHNHRPNRNLHPELSAPIQPPHRVPAVGPALLCQLRLLKRLLARPHSTLFITPHGLLLAKHQPAPAEAITECAAAAGAVDTGLGL
ncbi:hypothetical protein V491_09000 [Pseudogymnoascus sp. VKM F-3775]|nr:hypothetical protein V491_09000 [Pseudogymnoascus sp. VKM F-3775]